MKFAEVIHQNASSNKEIGLERPNAMHLLQRHITSRLVKYKLSPTLDIKY